MAHATKRPKEFTGRHMLLLMLAFFGTIIAVNLTLAYFAVGSWTGLIVKNSYVASQEYNDVLAEAQAQADLGWTSDASYGGGALSFSLNDRAGNPVAGWLVEAKLGRPIHENDDRDLTLDSLPNGSYRAAVDLAAGAWTLEVDASSSTGQTYRQVFKLWVPQDG